MSIPRDYEERVYAGVLGKIIGIYLGGPLEGWTYDRIMADVGEVWYYVSERLGKPLISIDDDINGTFTFLRALQDYGYRRDLTPAQIGHTWLNYIIERRTILWWGGLGHSTEHTAYLRLKSGIEAPCSGSISENGKVVAEQIGAQIFVDGWAMVAPGDPGLAADLARRAASVSHDGEAIYGAQVVAAMEAQAFVESDIDRLIDTGVSFIPRESVIYRMIADLRDWRVRESDWRAARELLAGSYGYDKYGGGCHIVPNHGLIILSLLYSDDSFQKALMIANTCGWDTDCNSGNVGCLMGIKNGLAGIEAGPDWRGPVADRLYLSTADGGRAITDAVTEASHIANAGRALQGEAPLLPKDGARFHFGFPGAVQGFQPERSPEWSGTVWLENVPGHSRLGERSLAVHYRHVAPGQVARIATPTFIPLDAISLPVYELMASPTLYPGLAVHARVSADGGDELPVTCRLYVRWYGDRDALIRTYGPVAVLGPGEGRELTWPIRDGIGGPIAEVGLEISSSRRADGTIYLDYLTWDGTPDVVFSPAATGCTMWRRAWVNGMDQFGARAHGPMVLVHNRGTGLLIQGTREWTDYRVSADVTPHLVKSAGVAARVQGMRRYYALVLSSGGKVRLVKALDGTRALAEQDFPWEFGQTYQLGLQIVGTHLEGWIGGQLLLEAEDAERPLMSGAVALVCEEGRTATQALTVQPAA